MAVLQPGSSPSSALGFPRGALALLGALSLASACDSGASSTTVPGGGGAGSEIGDFVWHDRDRDGIQDPGEPGLAGVRLGLFDLNGLLAVVETDAAGGYAFTDLPAGTYRIEIAPGTLPVLAVPGPCNAGTDDALDNDCAPVVLTLPDGDTDESSIDFGFVARCLTFDFETEDDLATTLVNGQDLTSPPEFGELFKVLGLPASGLTAAIFDSDPLGPNASSSDPDLLVDRGNLVILQEDALQSVPGIYDFPNDDARGGRLQFDFLSPSFPCSLDLIDICPDPGQDVFVVLLDRLGRRRFYHVPSGWTEDIAIEGPPGFRTLDLTTLADQPGFRATATALEEPGFDAFGVGWLKIDLGGSGAVDNLSFAPDILALGRVSGR